MLDKKRQRWIINTVLVVAVVAFAGFSLALPLSRVFQGDQADSEQVANTPTSQEEELAAQARGYELVLEREPDNEAALQGLLQARLELARLGAGDIGAVIEPLETLVGLYPDRTEYAVLLAQAKQQVGDREGAAQAYRDVLSSNPGDMNALRGLVSLLLAENRPEAAIGLLEDTLKTADDVNQIQPNSVDVTSAQLLLGQVYVEMGRDDEAIAIFDDAIRTSGDDFRPILSKALVLQELGRDDEAQPLFASAEALAPAEYKDEISRLAAGESATAGEESGESGLDAAEESNDDTGNATESESDAESDSTSE